MAPTRRRVRRPLRASSRAGRAVRVTGPRAAPQRALGRLAGQALAAWHPPRRRQARPPTGVPRRVRVPLQPAPVTVARDAVLQAARTGRPGTATDLPVARRRCGRRPQGATGARTRQARPNAQSRWPAARPAVAQIPRRQATFDLAAAPRWRTSLHLLALSHLGCTPGSAAGAGGRVRPRRRSRPARLRRRASTARSDCRSRRGPAPAPARVRCCTPPSLPRAGRARVRASRRGVSRRWPRRCRASAALSRSR